MIGQCLRFWPVYEKLEEAYRRFEDQERFCRVVDLEEIKDNDFNLNIARYVQITEPELPIDVAAELKVLKELTAERNAAETKMMGYLKELGYDG